MTSQPSREAPPGGGLTLEKYQESIYDELRWEMRRAGYSRFEAYDEELEVLIRYVLDRAEYYRTAFKTTNPVPQKGTNQ